MSLGAPIVNRGDGSLASLAFELPPELQAHEPPEARGLRRDGVRLMVSYRAQDRVAHARFRDLPDFLDPGDVLAINTSGTMNAALPARRAGGAPLELHLSTHLPADLWAVEVRRPEGSASVPFYEMAAGERLALPAGASVTLHTPYRADQRAGDPPAPVRLWIATLDLGAPLLEYLEQNGFPIRYSHVPHPWPLAYYQTVYANEAGSAEMPSAGRAFTSELITRLAAKGVQIAPLLLHTGVSSLEDHEPPYEEFYRVPPGSARLVNAARRDGRNVIAVGTTAARALETVADSDGRVYPGSGWTSLILTPARGMRAVNGLLTGLHEPRSSHLALLEALAGREHLRLTYDEALRAGYLWHEFGDLHLILP
jgi:S-adenosylmethionine:tRNA ribosyltransferase-isomerase